MLPQVISKGLSLLFATGFEREAEEQASSSFNTFKNRCIGIFSDVELHENQRLYIYMRMRKGCGSTLEAVMTGVKSYYWQISIYVPHDCWAIPPLLLTATHQ